MFLLKLNIKQNRGSPNKKYNVILKFFHQNIRAQTVTAVASNFDLLQIHFGGLAGVATPGKVCKFSPHLTLKSVFPELKLKQNCYTNMNFFFRQNWQFNHKVGPPFSTNIMYLKDYFYILTKYGIKATSKFQFLSYLVN